MLWELWLRPSQETWCYPDQERTAHTQLHTLRITTGMMVDKYMARFEMNSGRTGFNEAALEDTFIQGPPSVDSLQCLIPNFTNCPAWTAGRLSSVTWTDSTGDSPN